MTRFDRITAGLCLPLAGMVILAVASAAIADVGAAGNAPTSAAEIASLKARIAELEARNAHLIALQDDRWQPSAVDLQALPTIKMSFQSSDSPEECRRGAGQYWRLSVADGPDVAALPYPGVFLVCGDPDAGNPRYSLVAASDVPIGAFQCQDGRVWSEDNALTRGLNQCIRSELPQRTKERANPEPTK